MKKHECKEFFTEDNLAKSDTKIVLHGHCSQCFRQMLKVFRYQGTYERSTMKKLDPAPAESKSKSKDSKPVRFTPA